ncbi:MAG: hypothetical protein KDD51_13640, partial [Bdellovibrionales bacterium]|nr:hypothetical protein [Bdellovibrionales bacterium]
LGKFESYGHIADSLVFGSVLCICAFAPATLFWLYLYVGGSVFSAVLITKDEWVHTVSCPATENWLHALLFLNHPVLLFLTGGLWWLGEAAVLRAMIPFAVYAVSIYQWVAWVLVPILGREHERTS